MRSVDFNIKPKWRCLNLNQDVAVLSCPAASAERWNLEVSSCPYQIGYSCFEWCMQLLPIGWQNWLNRDIAMPFLTQKNLDARFQRVWKPLVEYFPVSDSRRQFWDSETCWNGGREFWFEWTRQIAGAKRRGTATLEWNVNQQSRYDWEIKLIWEREIYRILFKPTVSSDASIKYGSRRVWMKAIRQSRSIASGPVVESVETWKNPQSTLLFGLAWLVLGVHLREKQYG